MKNRLLWTLAFLLLLAPPSARAASTGADIGAFFRSDCDSITNPVALGTECTQLTTTGGRTAGVKYRRNAANTGWEDPLAGRQAAHANLTLFSSLSNTDHKIPGWNGSTMVNYSLPSGGCTGSGNLLHYDQSTRSWVCDAFSGVTSSTGTSGKYSTYGGPAALQNAACLSEAAGVLTNGCDQELGTGFKIRFLRGGGISANRDYTLARDVAGDVGLTNGTLNSGHRVIFDSSGRMVDGGVVDVSAHAYHNATQAIADNTVTYLAFNSERYDTDTMHDNSTNNSRITFTTAGKYSIKANACFDNSTATGGRYMSVEVHSGSSDITILSALPILDFPGEVCMNASMDYNATAGDYARVAVLQDSGVSLNIKASNSSTSQYAAEFAAHKIN